MQLIELYKFIVESVRPKDIPVLFGKGGKGMTPAQGKIYQELGSLFAGAMQGAQGKLPDAKRIGSNPQAKIYEKASPAAKKLIDHMSGKHGEPKSHSDTWFKPKGGYGFQRDKGLKGVRHLKLSGDARLIWFLDGKGATRYAISTHGTGNAYSHIIKHVEEVKSATTSVTTDTAKETPPVVIRKSYKEPTKKTPTPPPAPKAFEPKSNTSPPPGLSALINKPKKKQTAPKGPGIFQRLKNRIGRK